MTLTTMGGDSPLRTALLQRLANDLAIARSLCEDWSDAYWPCCWITYTDTAPGDSHPLVWLHRLCPRSCPHWHHQIEIALA